MAHRFLHFAAGAVVLVVFALPRPAFACGGECATVGGDTAATVLMIVAGVWLLLRAAGSLRQRLIDRRLRRAP